jgi:hypothetical protein
MKHLLWIVGLVALGPTLYFFNEFYKLPPVDESNHGTQYLIYAGIFFLISLVCFAVFFFIRFREEGEQDISITKF